MAFPHRHTYNRRQDAAHRESTFARCLPPPVAPEEGRMTHVPARTCLMLVLVAAAIPASASDMRLVDAVKGGDSRAVRTLLEQGVDVNARQGDGATALHWAAHLDDRATADLLISAGALVNATNDLGVTPLWIAGTNGSTSMVA